MHLAGAYLNPEPRSPSKSVFGILAHTQWHTFPLPWAKGEHDGSTVPKACRVETELSCGRRSEMGRVLWLYILGDDEVDEYMDQLVENTADDANGGEDADGEEDVKEAIRKVQELQDAET